MANTTPADADHWRRVDVLLTEALALAPADREAWIAGLAAADLPLVPLLRRMLDRASVEGDGFMSRPASATVMGGMTEETNLERPGADVGPYRLIRELGSGGMGRVWLAERTDGSLQRQVALKLPRMGWARGVAERLVQERDALAALEHPHIARLYDAGSAQGGRPYIAMEYIEGAPITDYALTKACTVAERLKLFLQVVSAVAYAHAHLIVHRDIKPQNILIGENGVAHLLDFGAAKLLSRDEAEPLTRQIGGAMSPDYASPEQIRGERITVASDIYSLGILLYELLTGARPYRLQRLTGAALEEAILKADVPRASAAPTLEAAYARQLRGDIDAIIAKATNRDPADRYGSAQALAEDVARHLAGEAVLAQPQSRSYRTWKFVQRNRLAVGATAGVLLALGIGAVVSLWQAGVARQQAARAARVQEFVTSIFTQAVPKTGVGGTVTAFDLLGVAAQRIDTELDDDPAVAAELGVIIADSYDALGYVAETEPVLRKAVERAERSFGPNGAVTLDAQIALISATMLNDPSGAL
jgi:serine/threonine-protein kinase